jgi:hypothetical protein
MRIAVRNLKRFLILAGLLAALLAVTIPALADYLGPNRSVSSSTMERLVCDYSAVYDPPGAGYYGCGLTLYEAPDGTCDSNVDSLLTSSACGWPAGINCTSVNCDVSRSSSVEGCNDGEPGCQEVVQVVDQPPATVSGSISCGAPGSGGWCRGEAKLSLSGSEPLSGYSILALEGTRNGESFACSGAACDVPLVQGSNSFSFWAVSSWGDTSLMGSASRSFDSQDPSLAGSVSGTAGDNGWYVSGVTVSASASDTAPGSGLASVDLRIDGGGWSGYSSPVAIGEGSHDVELRAVDGAGNSETQSLSIDVDTQSPIADLDASSSFCPGCGETLDITLVVEDGGSGIGAWSLTASGRTVASGGGATGKTIAWDGGGLGGGTHTLELEARDEAGNTSGASFRFALIAPTAMPADPTPTASPTQTGTPRVTSTVSTVNLGGPSTSLGAGLPAAPANNSSIDSISDQPSGSSSAAVAPAVVGLGLAALAVAGVATAAAVQAAHTHKVEVGQTRLGMGRTIAEAEAREAAQRAALAQARSEAEFNRILGQIWDQSAGGQESSKWLLRKETMFEPKVGSKPPSHIDVALPKEADHVAAEGWEQARGYRQYLGGERESVPMGSLAGESLWWHGIVSGVLAVAAWVTGNLDKKGKQNTGLDVPSSGPTTPL